MKKWKNLAVGFTAAFALAACGGGGGSSSSGGGITPTAEEWVLFATDTGNNVTAFKASGPSPIHTPIPQLGQTLNLGTLALGEIHLANGKVFVTVSSGLTGPAPDNLPSGGVVVVNPDTQVVENTVVLVSALKKADGVTPAASRPVHVYVDPEAKHLWVNNDGPSGDAGADSVFRINIDPADTANYLKVVEIPVGNGHKKSSFPRPSTNQPTAKKLFITSSLTEQRIDVIDDDPASGTYGQVIKIVRNVGGSPHGMDHSPNSGRSFAGITGGGVLSIDVTRLDLNGDSVIDFPDVDCAPGGTPPPAPGGTPFTGGTPVVNDNCVGSAGTAQAGAKDTSVYKLSTGAGANPTLVAGYVHSHTNNHGEDMVYTTGYSAGATKGFLNAINPGSGVTAPTAAAAIDLGNLSPSSFNVAGQKIYVPSSGNGTVHDKVEVVDADHDSGTFNTIIKEVTVGAATGENRNGGVSGDARLVAYPNTSTNTVSVIDTTTDTVIDTLTITGPTALTVGIVHLPFDAEDNH